MSNFVAGLTNTDPSVTPPVYKQYRYVQYNGNFPARATRSVSFPPSANNFRYVIIHRTFAQVYDFCIIEVKIFSRGTSELT